VPQRVYAALIALSFLLAFFSWRHIEKPVRDRRKIRAKTAFTGVSLSAVALLALSAGGWLARGYPERYAASDEDLLVPKDERVRYIHRGFPGGGECPASWSAPMDAAAAPPRLLLVGDSQAQDLYNSLTEAGLFPGYEKACIYIHTVCQIYFAPDRLDFVADEHKERCARITPDFVTSVAKDADVVILASHWQERAVAHISDTLEIIKKNSGGGNICSGQKGIGNDSEPA
jgi:hypothetical protein